MCDINSKTPMEKLTIGGNIYKAGNAREFKTGDWRSLKPIFNSEKCKQCGLCFPVCPEDSIPVNKDLKREDFDDEIFRKRVEKINKIRGICEGRTNPPNCIFIKME